MNSQKVVIYTTRFCPYCIRAKQLLDRKGLDYHEIPVDGDVQLRREMMEKSDSHTVPQIWIGETHVGGCNELMGLASDGQLDQLLADAR